MKHSLFNAYLMLQSMTKQYRPISKNIIYYSKKKDILKGIFEHINILEKRQYKKF